MEIPDKTTFLVYIINYSLINHYTDHERLYNVNFNLSERADTILQILKERGINVTKNGLAFVQKFGYTTDQIYKAEYFIDECMKKLTKINFLDGKTLSGQPLKDGLMLILSLIYIELYKKDYVCLSIKGSKYSVGNFKLVEDGLKEYTNNIECIIILLWYYKCNQFSSKLDIVNILPTKTDNYAEVLTCITENTKMLINRYDKVKENRSLLTIYALYNFNQINWYTCFSNYIHSLMYYYFFTDGDILSFVYGEKKKLKITFKKRTKIENNIGKYFSGMRCINFLYCCKEIDASNLINFTKSFVIEEEPGGFGV